LAIFDEAERQKQTVGKYLIRQLIIDHIDNVKSAKRSADNLENVDVKRAKPSREKIKSQLKVDFFGREIAEAIDTVVATESEGSNSNRVWIQYVEGFSNAVRKDTTWADLWVG
jgi:chromosome transmission fidelity protein 18